MSPGQGLSPPGGSKASPSAGTANTPHTFGAEEGHNAPQPGVPQEAGIWPQRRGIRRGG